jgi:hypothetical protein
VKSLADQFREGLKQAVKERKSDDIVQFIRTNWKLFCSSRRRMEDVCEDLSQRDDLNPTALADALGLPDCILFKKVKVVDTAKTLLRLKSSELYKTFTGLQRVKDGQETCLLVVAGGHTLVMTNMSTKLPPGYVDVRINDENDRCVSVFPAEDAPARLPLVFIPED